MAATGRESWSGPTGAGPVVATWGANRSVASSLRGRRGRLELTGKAPSTVFALEGKTASVGLLAVGGWVVALAGGRRSDMHAGREASVALRVWG